MFTSAGQLCTAGKKVQKIIHPYLWRPWHSFLRPQSAVSCINNQGVRGRFLALSFRKRVGLSFDLSYPSAVSGFCFTCNGRDRQLLPCDALAWAQKSVYTMEVASLPHDCFLSIHCFCSGYHYHCCGPLSERDDACGFPWRRHKSLSVGRDNCWLLRWQSLQHSISIYNQ
ncbi:hypothetical protein RRG08_025313 [Elysia crispata]|uniref:Uncharacterized protein n=1 Tax=Elysia crispata TaxID=231223 RepID=A0AAE1DUR5_9GAST|nr:hypothetical protein RRG08_025313 [Elysia crispata]